MTRPLIRQHQPRAVEFSCTTARHDAFIVVAENRENFGFLRYKENVAPRGTVSVGKPHHDLDEGSMTEERVFAELQSDASTLHESIRMHLERNFAPDARKYLRSFSSTEAAEFLGLAPGHLRKLHAEDKIPDVPLD